MRLRALRLPASLALLLALSSCGLNSKTAGPGAPSDLGFKGTLECAAYGCHADPSLTWSAGAHANQNALPGSAQASSEECASCHDPAGDGADAAWLFTPGSPLGTAVRPVAGCEGCHGSGSPHYAYAGTSLFLGEHRAPLLSTLSPMFPNPFSTVPCACHAPTRHNGPASAGTTALLTLQYPEWKGVDGPSLAHPDGHSDSLVVRTHEGRMTSALGGVPCAACHTVEGFVRWFARGETSLASSQAAINALVMETGDTGLSPPAQIPGPDALSQVSCISCHPSHEPWALVREVPGPAGASSLARLCFSCHGGAESPEPAIPHSPQRDVFLGRNGHEFPGRATSGGVSSHSGTGHLPDACVSCHHRVTADAPLSSYPKRVTNGHTFRPRADACVVPSCHPRGDSLLGLVDSSGNPDSAAYSYTDISSYSFSGARLAGRSASLKTEVSGLLSLLKARLIARGGAWDNPRQVFDLSAMSGLSSTVRGAAWNYDLIARDRSTGFHNPIYTRNLLAVSLSVLE